jgi:hypothetical protein
MVSRSLGTDFCVVFVEEHNIDNMCIDIMRVTLHVIFLFLFLLCIMFSKTVFHLSLVVAYMSLTSCFGGLDE